MRSFKIVLSIAAFMAAIFVVYTRFKPVPAPDVAQVADAANSLEAKDATLQDVAQVEAPPEALLSEEPISEEPKDPELTLDEANALGNSTEPVDTNSNALPAPSPNYPELYGYEIGHQSISEEEIAALVKRLRNDPALLQDLLNELRAETDPARIKRLTSLLGDAGNAEVLPVAEELVYSSSPDSRQAGLDLLSRLAPKNPEAYDIANSILGSEADPDVLVSTMNVLALPKNATAESRATSISQVMPLANHESAAVRRHSVSILVRLTNDQTLSPVLSNALHDSDPSVREAAVYAYASYPYQTAEAVQRLVDIVADPSEERGVRNGAILALNNMSPDETTKTVISTAKKQMRDALRAR